MAGRGIYSRNIGWRGAVLGAFLVAVPAFSYAAPIGDPKKAKPTYDFGISVGVARSDVDDPAGNADSETYPHFSFVGAIQFGVDRRVLAQLFFNSFTLDPGVQVVGQDVKQTGGSVTYQRRFDSQGFKPWLGAGIGYARNRFEDRLTVAADGFIAQRFPNREENAFTLVLSATNQWRVTNDWDVGVHLQYDYPLEGDVSTLSLSLLLLY